MTQQEEEFVHIRSSIDNLNHALSILQQIKSQGGNPLVGPAFEAALTAYSRAYTTSYGTVLDPKGKRRTYMLDQRHIPTKHLALHRRLLETRHKTVAHDDLSVKDASLSVVDIGQKRYACEALNVIHSTEELKNIDMIVELAEQTLDSLYIEEKLLEQRLPLSA